MVLESWRLEKQLYLQLFGNSVSQREEQGGEGKRERGRRERKGGPGPQGLLRDTQGILASPVVVFKLAEHQGRKIHKMQVTFVTDSCPLSPYEKGP